MKLRKTGLYEVTHSNGGKSETLYVVADSMDGALQVGKRAAPVQVLGGVAWDVVAVRDHGYVYLELK